MDSVFGEKVESDEESSETSSLIQGQDLPSRSDSPIYGGSSSVPQRTKSSRAASPDQLNPQSRRTTNTHIGADMFSWIGGLLGLIQGRREEYQPLRRDDGQ